MNNSELLGVIIITTSFTLYILSMTIFAEKLDACEASLKRHFRHYKFRFRNKPIPTINASAIINGDQLNFATTSTTATKNNINAAHSQNGTSFLFLLSFIFIPLRICKYIVSRIKRLCNQKQIIPFILL